MDNTSLPSARPVPADAVISRSHTYRWVAGAVWLVSGIAVIAIVGWVTGADIFYAVVVAFVALNALDGRLTLRRALTHLAFAAGLVLVGVLVFAQFGVGESTPSRIVQGAGGLAAAALIMLAVATARRFRSRRKDQTEH